jgi:hypothetical protein
VIGKSVFWNELIAVGKSSLHRFWQESSSGSMVIWHDQSEDSGLTWGSPEIVSSFLGNSGLAGATMDTDQQIHLLQVVEKGESDFVLQHSVWKGVGWENFENAELGKGRLDVASALSVAVSPNGRMGVVVAGSKKGEVNGQILDVLVYTERRLDLSNAPVQVNHTAPVQTTGTPQPTVTPTLQPSPTLDLASLGPSPNNSTPIPIDSEYAGLIIGAGLVGITIAFVVGLRILSTRLRNQVLRKR